jgi:adenylate kinase family enzyme
MSFIFDQENPSAITFKPLGGGEDTGFSENFDSAYRASLTLNRSDSRPILIREQWDPILKEVQEKTGKKFINPGNYLGGYAASSDTAVRGYNYSSKQILDYIKERPETFPDLLEINNEVLFEKAKKSAIKAIDIDADVGSRSTFTGWLGSVGGSIVGSITDPVNLAAMPFGGGSSTVLNTIFKQSAIAAVSEGVIQTEVQDWYKTLDLPYDYKTFFANVGMAAAGAGVVTGGVLAAKPLYQLTKKQLIEGIEALGKARANREGRPYEVDPDVKIIKELDDIDTTINQGNVLKDDAGNLEHNARVEKSYRAIENGDSTKITNAPPENEIEIPKDIYFHDNLNGEMFAYKPNDLLVDAKLFQFKQGGDVLGVTDRLQGVTSWDPVKANTAIVYEFADGRTFIADGHQRLALAKRLQEADPSADIQIYAFKIREVDGDSPAKARATAAGKNLAEGTGTLVDAAMILRDAPELIKSLPPRSAFVKQAGNLRNLEGDAWYAIVNELVPAHYGAIVGDLIKDPAQQLAVLKLLRRTDPANVVQAEQIVRQAREAGFVKTEQAGLFGDEDIAESLFLERAKILDRALKELRKDQELFETLVKNANDIEEAGNTLAKLSNQEKEVIYGKAIAIIQNNANVRGPISDNLTRFAKAWKDSGGTKIETYVRDFAESVRRAIEDGNYERLPNGGDRGDLTTPAQGNRGSEPGTDDLGLFNDGPGSTGSARQANQLQEDLTAKVTDPEPMPREGMNPDELERQNLKEIIDRGATIQEIESHPAVINAIELAKTIPETRLNPGYGTDSYRNTREFDFAGESVIGYTGAVDRLYEQAKRLGWIDEQLPYNEGNVLQNRQATIVLGPPAAGKSTVANRIAQARGASIIDGDEAKKILPEYRDGIGANAVHEESQDIINGVLERAVTNGDNIVIPKVGKSFDSIDGLVNSLKEDGYTVSVLNVAVPSDVAYVRMISRFINSGRLINPEYFRAIGDNPTKTYQALKQKGGLDGYAEIDYSGAKNAPIPITDESGNILEGVSLRLRRGGEEGAGQIYRAPETGTGREFGEIESNPGLLDLEVPVGERIDPVSGERVASVQTVRELLEEFKQDETMINRLVGCVK